MKTLVLTTERDRHGGDLDGNTVNSEWVVPVREYTVATVQGYSVSNSWTTAVVTFERSNDGSAWAAFPTAVTLTADGFTSVMDVSGIAFIRARVSTAKGSALLIRLVACMKGDA